MFLAESLVSCFVRRPHKFANLRGQTAPELVLFVHDFMRAGVMQFPTQNVVAAADINVGFRREVADQVD